MHNITVGTIFSYSWGYDQTNADFFEVVKVTNKTVTIRQIESITESGGDCGFMSDRQLPVPGKFLEGDNHKPLRKVVKETNSLRMDYGTAYPWDGQSKYNSWYA